MDIKALISKMTLQEKLAQMSQFNAVCILPDSDGGITGPAQSLSLTQEEINATGSTLNIKNAEDVIKIQKHHMENDPNKIPLLFMQDIVHGFSTIYPIPLAMGATFDPKIMEDCSAMAAKEATVGGIHVTFAPMVDLVRDCRWGRCMESTGEDPYLNCLMSEAQVRGFQGDMTGKYDIAACVKHFAAYGAAEAGRDYNTVDMSEKNLREFYLPAYKAAIDANVEMLMTSFNLINGVPSSGNKWLVNDILRKEWGFDGIVISDYNAFNEMKTHGYAKDSKDCALKALDATSDIEMMSVCYLKHAQELLDEGKISMEQIDKAVERILLLKDKLGLFENPYKSASMEACNEMFLCKEHRDLCRVAAEKSAVLLKNEGVLPLNNPKSVAVVGPYGNVAMLGSWSCHGKESDGVSVVKGLENAGVKVTYAKGCDGSILEKPDMKEIKNAVKCAKKASAVIICAGESNLMSGEGTSRADVTLSDAQKTLIREIAKVNKNCVVVLFSGRPLALSDVIDDAPAFVEAWQPGTEGGSAIASLLLGKVNFEGRLPMSFPTLTGQAPIYYNRHRSGRPAKNRFHTYSSRYIDTEDKPLFPFGYGLSYTNFEISAPVLDKTQMTEDETINVSVKVKNVGKREGTTLVQMYINDVEASLTRPIRELKNFKKVTLKAGEEVTVSFPIGYKELAFYTAEGKFGVEKGTFKVFVCDNAHDGDSVAFELV